MAAGLTWRDETDDDQPFLLELYASTRADELAVLGWDAAQLDQFVSMQFRVKEADYRSTYPNAERLIAVIGAHRVGRMVLDRGPDDVVLVDVALVPGHRNAGHGSQLLQAIVTQAGDDGLAVRLHVDKGSAALRLYQRFGFQVIADHGFSWAMERRPGPPV
jgi:ribosomal protein S18 acetylase RimI-like enzyme